MAITKITSQNYEAELIDKERFIIIDFYADWCGPCKMAAPLFDKLSDEYEDVKFCKINIDEETTLVNFFGISSVPTFVFVKDGVSADAIVGLQSESSMREFIEKNCKD